MHHYPFHIGDYTKDTRHLSVIEHGTYRLLLDWYYASEAPLADDVDTLCRICGAVTKLERQAVERVLGLFFERAAVEGAQVWMHKRVEEELAKYRSKGKAGRKGMAKRWGRETDDNTGDNNGDNKPPNESVNNQYARGNQEPITNNQEPKAPPLSPRAGGTSRSPAGLSATSQLDSTHSAGGSAQQEEVRPPMDEAAEAKKEKGGAAEVVFWAEESGWQGITEARLAMWSKAYPACDLDRQLAAMHAWLMANPRRAKKSNWAKFITNWLQREQDKGGDLRGRGMGAGSLARGTRNGGAPAAPVKGPSAEPGWDWRGLAAALGWALPADQRWDLLMTSQRYELRQARENKKKEGGVGV